MHSWVEHEKKFYNLGAWFVSGMEYSDAHYSRELPFKYKVSDYEGTAYAWYIFHHILKGRQFWDFLFAFLHTQSLLKKDFLY